MSIFSQKISEEGSLRRKNSIKIIGYVLFFALITSLRIQSPAQILAEGQSAAALIKKALDDKEMVTAKLEITQIIQNIDRYIYEERELMALGIEYLEAGKPHLAAVVFTATAEVFPESLNAMRLLAHSYYRAGDEERGLQAQAKMIAARGKAELAGYLEKNRGSLASTAGEVIGRCLEATGGREAWEDIKTMVVIFSLQSSGGEQLRMERLYKRPSFYRQGLEGGVSFLATDGTRAWQVSNGKWAETENVYLRFASMDNWLLNYERIGISYSYMGFDHINGSPVYHLYRTFNNGTIEDLYFSADTNLLTEIRSDYIQSWPFMKSFMSLWNYREVESVKIPFVFIRNLGALEPPHGGVVAEVKINVPLDDSLFLPPDHKK